MTHANKTAAGLELLEGGHIIIDEAEAVRVATTEFVTEANEDNLGSVDLVHLGKLLGELSLGDIGAAVVDDIDKLKEEFRPRPARKEVLGRTICFLLRRRFTVTFLVRMVASCLVAIFSIFQGLGRWPGAARIGSHGRRG